MRRRLAGLAFAVAASALMAAQAKAVVTSGMLLTNFLSATFALPGGAGVNEADAGVSLINIPNSASSWVLVTDSPQMCFAAWKRVIANGSGTPLVPPAQYAGEIVCFEIGFSNCGGMSGFSVLITDAMPGNVVKAPPQPGSLWVAGGYGTVSAPWSTSLNGPWYVDSNTGQYGPLYLRWLVSRVGMHKTGYVRYCVTVL